MEDKYFSVDEHGYNILNFDTRKKDRNDGKDSLEPPAYVLEGPPHSVIENKKSVTTHNETLDNDSKYTHVELLKHVDDNHILKRMAIQISAESWINVNTVFLAGLGLFSTIACRGWEVAYQYGDSLPIGLYVIIEQPSGVGKGWVLHRFAKPFFQAQNKVIADLKKRIKELCEFGVKELNEQQKCELKELQEKLIVLFITNATSEGLEKTLANTGGYFSAVSSEQGLLDVLLGMAYGNGNANNNDILLNGFDGGHVSCFRSGRQGYSGNVIGGVVCFAQQGSVDKVLGLSNGTGLSERFLMLVEPHSLGLRDHSRKIKRNDQLFSEYEKLCEFAEAILLKSGEENSLKMLTITETGYSLIAKYQNRIEPHLADGGQFSHISLRGAAAKINMQIMKIAANLHLLDRVYLNPVIADKHILSAIGICGELLNAELALCKAKGILGSKAEYSAILSLFEKDQRPRTERNIIQIKVCTKPFKEFSSNKSMLIRKTLTDMVSEGLLKETWQPDGTKLFSLGQ